MAHHIIVTPHLECTAAASPAEASSCLASGVRCFRGTWTRQGPSSGCPARTRRCPP
jgi:hypothetical protein